MLKLFAPDYFSFFSGVVLVVRFDNILLRVWNNRKILFCLFR